jgi:hypothetical protein
MTSALFHGCGTATELAEEPDYAVPVVESALKSISNGDYDTYVTLFIDEARSQLSEDVFRQAHQLITGKIGNYKSKTFSKVKVENGYKVAYYEAEFTEEPDIVTIRAVFDEEDDQMKLAGFWLDSPKLRN